MRKGKRIHPATFNNGPSTAATQAGRTKLRAKVLLSLCSLFIGLLIAEIMLRAINYTYPIFYMQDENCGYALRPNTEGWFRREGESYVRINSEGLRDREHSKVKAENTIRIAVIGDSFAEAMHVPMEDTFWAVMERRLQQCERFGGRQVEVINFGVSGYGTAQELITFRQKAWAYSPDIVLLAVTTFNDFIDNSRALKGSNDVPYFVLRNGSLVLDDSFRESPVFHSKWLARSSAWNRFGRWLRDNSRVVQLLHETQARIKSWIDDRKRPPRPMPKPGEKSPQRIGEADPNPVLFSEPTDPETKEAWEVTDKLIVQMRDEVQSRGAKFLVVTLSYGIQVHPDAQAREAFL
ncbi:MAG: SGNH/GDSL hydrolase family protein, partial [Pyrinomonadaceae bacterium]